MTYETTAQPGSPGDSLDDFATAAEALAYVNYPTNEAELHDDANTHTAQADIETYADFLAAA